MDPTSLLLRLLLARSLGPLSVHMREWATTGQPLEQVFEAPVPAPAAATAVGCHVSLPVQGDCGGDVEDGREAGRGQGRNLPCPLPAFLSPLQQMFELSGRQLRLLCAWEDRIGETQDCS